MKRNLLIILLCVAAFFSLTAVSGCSISETNTAETSATVTTVSQTTAKETKSTSITTEKVTSAPAEKSTKKETTEKKTTKKETTVKGVTKKPRVTTTVTKSVPEQSCIITIECKSILSNMERLADGHAEFVPSDGYIIKNYKCDFDSDDTAYDILKKACGEKDIKLTARNSVYGTYVSGINNLDEFDCGQQSGWLYSVNGKSPNISCGKYKVSPGDKITFSYTCKI